VEAAYHALRAVLLTPAAMHAELARNRYDLGLVTFTTAWFAQPGAAREARLAVREDGQPLSELAGRLGAPVEQRTHIARHVRGLPLGHRLAAGVPGEVFGPAADERGWLVAQVLACAPATLD